MRLGVPIIGVVGHKRSGKTTVIESIVQGLTKKGYKVATAKHISQKGFSMDARGKDTWRHARAGANPVISVSDVEIGVLIKNGMERFSLDELRGFTSGVDVVLLEGFSQMILDNEHMGKILCVRNEEEYEEFKNKTRRKIIAFCAFRPMKNPILRIKEDSRVLVGRVLGYVERELKTLKILRGLPGLNCKKCGFPSCEELAVAIHGGRAKLSDCLPLRLKSKLKTKITVNNVEVPIQPFVSEIIRNSVLGMVSSLKGVSIEGNETVHIEISS